MTKFFTLKTCEPFDEQLVLIKTENKHIYEPAYFVCEAIKSDSGHWIFEEVGGMQSSCWYDNEIIGWMPLYALDDIEVI